MAEFADMLPLCSSIMCLLVPIAMLALAFIVLFVWTYKPLGGGRRLVGILDTEFHENNPRGRYIWGTADIMKDPMEIRPMFAGALNVPKSSVVEAVEMKSPTNNDVMVFYMKDGILCYIQIKAPRDFDAGTAFPGKTKTMDLGLFGYEKHMMNLQWTQGALDEFFGNPDMGIVGGKAPAAVFGAGSLYLLDPGGPKGRSFGRINKDDAGLLDRMPFVYKAYSSLPMTGALEMGLEIYPEALKVRVPGSGGFIIPKTSIIELRKIGSRTPLDFLSMYRGGITISHKEKKIPKRISFYLRDVDGIVDALKSSGYKVS